LEDGDKLLGEALWEVAHEEEAALDRKKKHSE
jgi:hypothetical protein